MLFKTKVWCKRTEMITEKSKVPFLFHIREVIIVNTNLVLK